MPSTFMAKIRRRGMRTLCSVGSSRECPLCGWTGTQFLPRSSARKPSSDAMCPRCESYERHRLAKVFLADRLGRPEQTLHIAPEPSIEPWLRSISQRYVSGDLNSPRAEVKMDITAMPFDDGSFDFVWCSHVLEHIPDDAAAMREMLRVLSPGGHAMVQVPVCSTSTYEDASITSPEDRLREFYQEDHVRRYGVDVADRLRSAGFAVEVLEARTLDPALLGRHALGYVTTNEIFYCTKPGP